MSHTYDYINGESVYPPSHVNRLTPVNINLHRV
jgi:hypothetical protein